jgi:hypothetical protein
VNRVLDIDGREAIGPGDETVYRPSSRSRALTGLCTDACGSGWSIGKCSEPVGAPISGQVAGEIRQGRAAVRQVAQTVVERGEPAMILTSILNAGRP